MPVITSRTFGGVAGGFREQKKFEHEARQAHEEESGKQAETCNGLAWP